MRISDWSSDVCSSDLIEEVDREDRLLRGFVAYAGIDVDPRGDLCLELRIAGVSPQLCVERRSAVLRRGFEQRDVVKLDRRVGEQIVGTKLLHRDRQPRSAILERSEARRVGKECVSTGRSRGSPFHYKKTQ